MKHNTLKKLLSLLLVICMMASFAGCIPGEEDPTEPSAIETTGPIRLDICCIGLHMCYIHLVQTPNSPFLRSGNAEISLRLYAFPFFLFSKTQSNIYIKFNTAKPKPSPNGLGFGVWYGYLEDGFERRLLASVRWILATAVAIPQKSESVLPHQHVWSK